MRPGNRDGTLLYALHTNTAFSCSVCVQTYKSHERSREAIEMAFDSILQEKMKVRHKQGFRPPRRGRKTDLEGDAPVCITLLLP